MTVNIIVIENIYLFQIFEDALESFDDNDEKKLHAKKFVDF
jgi:hypothetical protein